MGTDKRAKYTEGVIGSEHPSKEDVANRLVLIEHENDGTHKSLTMGPGKSIHDSNNDTKIYVEKNANEDMIRMDCAGVEVLIINNTTFNFKAKILSNIAAPTLGSHIGDRDYNDDRYGRFVTDDIIYYYGNSAPAGWTYESSLTDKVLAVKGGSNAYDVNGGNEAGSWTQPNHNHNHNHSGLNHSHSFGTLKFKTGETDHTGELFMYNVSGSLVSAVGIGRTAAAGPNTPELQTLSQQFYTKDGSGSTGSTSPTTGYDATNSATATTYRPAAAVGILIRKS